MLNSAETEVHVPDLKQCKNKFSNDMITLNSIALVSDTHIKNMSIIFNQDLSFDSLIKKFNGLRCSTFVILQKPVA